MGRSGIEGEVTAGGARLPHLPPLRMNAMGVIARAELAQIDPVEREWLCHGLGILRAHREFHLKR